MLNGFNRLMLLSILLFGLISCSGENRKGESRHVHEIKDISAISWEKLSQKKIYFGHQSVGANILHGINDLMKEHPQIKLRIVETNAPESFNSGLFAHSRVGSNTDPQSKIDSFAKTIENGLGEKADIAFFKFCYVDFTPDTDVLKLFDYYKETMNRLSHKYPGVIFVHVTVPLTVKQAGLKAWAKRLLEKPVSGYEDNVKRSQYNELIRKEYLGKTPVFDLADIEATLPDGKKSMGEINGKSFYALNPSYSSDGGHLNEMGRKEVADHLLSLLVELTKK